MSVPVSSTSLFSRLHANRGMLFPLACMGLLIVLLVPLPTGLLDFLLVLNITLSVIVLVTTMYVRTPLEFAVFPSLLLAVTLFRLVLNVATTRLILTAGNHFSSFDSAQHAAGEVVLAFSKFVTNEKLAVGAVIFLIIFIIQFIVITKGCSRISEVHARFVLDAMPGKQMAIDSDLSAGVIKEPEARQRREEVHQQADFYGAMDGASKFVRGDAIASVLITAVNIIGGLCIGVFDMKLEVKDAAQLFTILTIGDGLVTQIPAFIVSMGAGLIITRSSSKTELGEQVIGQMIAKPKALVVAAAFLVMLAFTGLPAMPLLIMGSACAALAYIVQRHAQQEALALEPSPSGTGKGENALEQEPPVEKLLDLDALELEVGPGLLKLADPDRHGDLLDRIRDLRKHLAKDLGVIVPAVHVHDNPDLSANDYIIKIRGLSVARGVTYSEQFLAIAPADVTEMPDAESTSCPVTQAPAYWITESQLSQAKSLGYDLIEAPEVLITHLAEIIRTHAHELLTRQEVKNLLDNLKLRSPALVDEIIPNQIKPGELHRVLQNLLRERVSIRDLETILETIADESSRTKDLDDLTEHARRALSRSICRQYVDDKNRLTCLTLDPALEQTITRHIDPRNRAGVPGLPPPIVQRLIDQLRTESDQLSQTNHTPVVLCSPSIRAAVRRLLEASLPRIPVLSYTEIAPDVSIEQLGCIGSEPAIFSPDPSVEVTIEDSSRLAAPGIPRSGKASGRVSSIT